MERIHAQKGATATTSGEGEGEEAAAEGGECVAEMAGIDVTKSFCEVGGDALGASDAASFLQSSSTRDRYATAPFSAQPK